MLRCSIYKVQSPLALASSFISLPHSISFVKYFFRFSRTFFLGFRSLFVIATLVSSFVSISCPVRFVKNFFRLFSKSFFQNRFFGPALSSARLVYYTSFALSTPFFNLFRYLLKRLTHILGQPFWYLSNCPAMFACLRHHLKRDTKYVVSRNHFAL